MRGSGYKKLLPNISKTLSDQYYAERIVKKDIENKQDRRCASHERQQEIADHIRSHGRSSAKKHLHCSERLMDKVEGEMYLGRM